MKKLFKQDDGRLKTSRIAILVFIGVLVCLGMVYQAGKSAQKVMVKVEHVFKAEDEKKPEPAVVKPVPRKSDPKEKTAQQDRKQDQKQDQNDLPKKSVIEGAKEKPAEKQRKIAKENGKPALEQEKQIVQDVRRTEPVEIKAFPDDTIRFDSKKYFEIYQQWQEQGKTLDKGKPLVGLEIQNLEKVYDLFQMKVVVLKDGVPHTDLEDHSRVAALALNEFSSTCFVVNHPWEKWGKALGDAGFAQNDSIEIRYYTYAFVRDAIYARAMKAFEWAVKTLELPDDTDPEAAKVSGAVYEIQKTGGGSFGVFVPLQVVFQSHGVVDIDIQRCFGEQLSAVSR